MFEAVGFRLFNLAGVEAPHTHWVQFRIIDEVQEANPTNQFQGDFWGLYLATEQEDGRFLDEHGLSDGNFYKMEGGSGELNNQGATAVTDKSDLNQFMTTYRGSPTDDWWRAKLDLSKYYSYRVIVEGIHHYDIDEGAGKNYFYYLNPATGRWSVHPWDLDLTWANNMYGGGNSPFKNRVLPRAAFNLEYKNRLRELRDLLFNTDQAFQLIDEYAAMINDPAGAPSITGADRAQWDYNPIMVSSYIISSKAGQGRFYQFPRESASNPALRGSFAAGVQIMKNYVVSRGTWMDSTLANDPNIPKTPTVTPLNPTNFPANRLSFRCSAFQSSAGTFAAMQWRLAEVTPANRPAFDPAAPRQYEICANWESGALNTYVEIITIPPDVAKVGHVYRVRARMKDNAGRWSHWSAPVQFVASEPDQTAMLQGYLRITELMYNSPAGSEFDFIELHDTNPTQALELGGVKFTQGIDFTFAAGMTIPPGGYLLVVKTTNAAAFRAHYGLADNVILAGPYSGNLDNGGEQITLKSAAAGTTLFSFGYGDGQGWPVAADGMGHSLVPANLEGPDQAGGGLDYGGNWRASSYLRGSPGRAEQAPTASLVINEFMAHTDYNDPRQPEYESNDWIELYNPTDNDLSLAGWYLSDEGRNLKKWALPGVTVPARGWISFDEISGFHQPITNGFGLSKAGEQVILSYLPGTSEDRVVDAVSFKGQESEVSLGRYPDGGQYWQALAPTRGGANKRLQLPVVLSELMYHPPDLSGTNDNVSDEYVELHNPLSRLVQLFDTNGAWRLDGEIKWQFAANTTLPAGGCLVVVGFSPTNSTALAAFRNTYGLTNRDLVVLGPYEGRLGNSSGRVALEKPLASDLPSNPVCWVIVDEVVYGDQAPWPTAADGYGKALHRQSVLVSGNDPANWKAATPTPGHVSVAEALKIDSVRADNGAVIIQFTAPANAACRLEYCDALGRAQWQPFADVPTAHAGRIVTLTNTVPAEITERYYRLTIP
jgi:hypothetical protein